MVTGIDVHAHYVAPELLDVFRGPDGERIGVTVERTQDGRELFSIGGSVTNQPMLPALTHEKERLGWMDEHAVGIQVVSPWMQLNGYQLSAAQGRDLARLQNDSIADLVRRHPDRFAGAATLPMQDPGAATAEARRVAEDLGFRAVQIGTHVNDMNLTDPLLDQLWEEVAALELLVLLHPFTVPDAARLRVYVLDWLVGFPAETTHAAGDILLGGLFERHPRLKMSLPHGGGFLPYQIGRLDRGFEVLGDRTPAQQRPSTELNRFFFDGILHDSMSLRFLIDRVGPSRVVLGSDFPFNLGESDPLGRLAAVQGLGPDERAAIASGNATGALCLDAGGCG